MNLIDLIQHELLTVNSDLSTWVLKFYYNVHGNKSSVKAHNTMMHRKRAVRFYINYEIDKETCNVKRTRIVFMQPDVGNMEARDRLSNDMAEILKQPLINDRQELEKAARIILNVSKNYE